MAKTDKNELVKARCLQSFYFKDKAYITDDIFTGTQAEIDSLLGYVDPHKDAVSYIEGLK